jgi:hypothetical protein
MNKKFIGIFIVVLLMGTAILPGVMACFEQNKKVINSINDSSSSLYYINETYLIANPKVPYVGQGNDSFCALASTAMQINYQGYNTTLPEILHDVGYGYLRIYCNFILPSRLPLGGAGITQMDFSMEFLAEIYNLTFKDFSLIKDPEEDSLWDSYYERIKDLISSDIPIQTGVDPYRLTFWNERLNFSNETTGGHAVIIVGNNEINNTI